MFRQCCKLGLDVRWLKHVGRGRPCWRSIAAAAGAGAGLQCLSNITAMQHMANCCRVPTPFTEHQHFDLSFKVPLNRVAKESSEMLDFLDRYLLRSSLDCLLPARRMTSQTVWKLFLVAPGNSYLN